MRKKISFIVAIVIVVLFVFVLWISTHANWVGEQSGTSDYVHKTVGLITDMPHATAELFYSAIENGIVLSIGYWLAKRNDRKEHAKLDQEHGIEHDQHKPL
jgi:hypothetical protein